MNSVQPNKSPRERREALLEDKRASSCTVDSIVGCPPSVTPAMLDAAGETDRDFGAGLQDWLTNNDKFEADEDGLTRMSFPCCACKHQRKTDTDEPCWSCGHNLNMDIDKPNASPHAAAVSR